MSALPKMSAAPKRGDTMPDRRFGPVDQAMIHDYARASGDDNPVHLDHEVAASVGLQDTILHGMYLMGLMDRALHDWRGDVTVSALSAKFLTPVLSGSQVVVSGKIVADHFEGRPGHAVIRLFVRTEDGQVALMGEARLVSAMGEAVA